MDLLMLAAALAGLAVLTAMLALGSLLNANHRIGTRLETYVSAADYAVDMPSHQADPVQQEELPDKLNRLLSSRSFSGRIRRRLARADIPLTVPELILLQLAAVLLPMALALLLTGRLASTLAAGAGGYLLPTLWIRQRQRRRLGAFQEQLPELLGILVNSLRAGFSVNQALANIAQQASEPAAGELRRVVHEIRIGRSTNEALSSLALRMESQDLELVVTVLKIQMRVGGNLVPILENISRTIRERTRLRREIRVITAQQRFSSYVLALLPVILTGLLLLLNPDYILKLFEPGWLLCIPIGALLANVLGFLLIRRIVDIRI